MVGNCLTEAMVTRTGVEEEELCLIPAQLYHRSEHRTSVFLSRIEEGAGEDVKLI